MKNETNTIDKGVNQFVVDLVALELIDEQRTSIEKAIHTTVAVELAKIPQDYGKLKFVPP